VRPAAADIELGGMQPKDEEENLNASDRGGSELGDDDKRKLKNDELDEVSKIFYEKKKTKHRVFPTVLDFLCVGCSFLKPCRKYKKARYDILERCIEITDKYLQINFLMRKFFEIEYMKKILLSENQRHMLKYQFKYINFNNLEESNRFLDSIQKEKVTVDRHLLEKDEAADDSHKKLIMGVRNYFNF
jgi:hypothetical protein